MTDHTVDAETLIETFPRHTLTPSSDAIEIVELPANPARTVPAAGVIPPVLTERYPYEPYSHQAAALEALAAGEHVAVTTDTASGKTHVYALQIARNLLDAGVLGPDGSRATEPAGVATALCVLPTKALAQDQREALETLYERMELDVRVERYDGDTTGDRRAIRERADVIITNFAGLNVYLPHHEKWSRFLDALELVVIDESHTYTGIQGMHVAWILRRLRRVVEYWGGDPQYVLTSATIGNPREHAETLVDAPVTVVDEDGAPRGPRDVVLWNPPPDSTDDADANAADGVAARVPASVEAPKVFDHLTGTDVRTLLFCPSRKLTELAIQRTDEHRRASTPLAGGVDRTAYHAGLGRRTRRTREERFKRGALAGLATTSALELGIDIGDLEATVLMGYPGQRQAFWQRIGRAGRGTGRSLAVLVGDHRTLDQYVMTHPDYLLETDVEDAVVDVSNDAVFARHLLCAATELAVETTDAGTFADEERLEAAVRMWREAGFLEGYLDAGVHYCGPQRPETRVDLYGAGGTRFQLRLVDGVDRDRWGLPDGLDLEPIDRHRAYRDYHEGAVRLHGGRQFEVVRVDEQRAQPVIELVPVDCEYYTRTRRQVTVLDAESETSRSVNGFTLHFGQGTVLVDHDAYDRISVETGQPIRQRIPTGSPPIRMETQLCWVEVPPAVEDALVWKYREFGTETGIARDEPAPVHLGYVAGLHAAEHATIQTAPLELRVDKGDLGGLATLVLDTHFAHPDRSAVGEEVRDSFAAARHALERRGEELGGRTTSGWFIYDGIDGGLGFARAIYEDFEALAERARDQLRDCQCARPNGCPACTFDERCGNDNTPLLRAAAVDVLECLLGEADPAEFAPPDAEPADRRPVVFFS